MNVDEIEENSGKGPALRPEGRARAGDLATRRSLLGRLQDWGDDESWKVFFETYRRLIYNFAVQRGLTHQEAEEVLQETVLAVAKSIPRFEYDPARCAFKTWLLRVTSSKIANQFKKRGRHEGEGERAVDLAESDLECSWDEEWKRNIFAAAIDRLKRKVSAEQFQMFDLYVLKEWPVADVARTIGVSRAHVYVAKHRLSKLLARELEELQKSEE